MALVSRRAKARFEGWFAEHPGDPHNPILVEVGQVGEDPIFVLSMPLALSGWTWACALLPGASS